MSKPSLNRRSFLKIVGGSVAAVSLGYFAWDTLKPSLEVKSFESLDTLGPFDVCIIGSGPAGAVLGQDLVDKGLHTVILESGPNLKSKSYDERLKDLEQYESSGSIQYPVVATRMRALGGTSNLWTGVCPRLTPADFAENPYTPKGAPWPISYADLEPYYERAEKTLRVRGGKLSEFQAPRKEDLPPLIREDISTLKPMLEKVDVAVDPAVSSQTNLIQNGPIRVARDYLPQFSASPGAALVSGVTVTHLVADPAGKIVGAAARNLDGKEKIVQAKTYVVACGALETPRLLLLSQSNAYPNGIGNNYDQVGRFFMEHPNHIFFGKIQGMKADDEENGRSYQFNEAFRQEGLGGVLLGFRTNPNRPGILRIHSGIEMQPAEDNRVKLDPNKKDLFGNPVVELSFGYTEADRRTFERANALVKEIFQRFGTGSVEDGNITWSHHHMGTCRMGDDPRTSVVDQDLRVHETENLYIISSAVFVTSGVGNPTLTITALAHRLGEHLGGRPEL